MRKISAVLAVLLLAGCSSMTAKPRDQWVAESWAKMGYDEAEANCHAAIQRSPTMGYWSCMRAVGWREQ